MKAPRLAIILPCYDEEEVLPITNARLLDLLASMKREGLVSADSYLLYVDDGSRDATWDVLRALCEGCRQVQAIRLAANVGHQKCVVAGMEYALGRADAVVTVDADLQDDIEAIPKMMERYREGCDIVYGVRDNRDADSPFKRRSARWYYRTLRSLGVDSIDNHADFRLLSARALKDLMRYSERNIYLRGIVPQLGYRQESVSYARCPRAAGKTKYPLRKMINLAIDGVTSFSVRPVRLVAVAGIIFLAIALVMLAYVMVRYFSGETIEGWTSLILSVWFCSGVILIGLGVVGEYIGKIYTEVKRRPLYSVMDTAGEVSVSPKAECSGEREQPI